MSLCRCSGVLFFQTPHKSALFQQMKQSCANYNKRFQAVTVGHIRIWCYWLSCGVKWLNSTDALGQHLGVRRMACANGVGEYILEG
jgi:hypothetical protein